MTTRAELKKELNEDGMGTRNPVIGGSKEDGTLIHNEGLVQIGENLPLGGGTWFHIGETVYYISKGEGDEAAKHAAEAGVSVLIPSSGNTFVDYATGEVVSFGVKQGFEKMQQGDSQESQESDISKILEIPQDIGNYFQQITESGKHNPDNYQTKPPARYDSDLQKQYEQEMKDSGAMDADGNIPTEKMVEAGDIGRKYDQKQAERNEHKQSENDGNQLKKDTPNLDNPSKDTPQTDDGKSLWESFKEGAKDLWDWLRGKDQDDSNTEQEQWNDEDGGLPPGTVDDEGTPIEKDDGQGKDTDNPNGQPESPNGKGESEPNGQPESPNGKGENEPNGEPNNPDNPNTPQDPETPDPNGKSDPLKLPGAGSGFGAGLGGGTGFGTLGACEPYAAYKVVDPLLISLQQSQATGAIRITSYNDDTYQGKMLDLNGDGIANKVSWIGKDTGVLFHDANDNNQMDGVSELLRDGVETENGETTQNGFDYVSKLLDTDGNKVFDSNDETFNQVKVLSLDENGDEVTQTLQELKIKSLDLNYQEVPLSNQYKYSKIQGESFVTQKSTYITEKGKVGQLVDVNLSYDTVNTQYTNNIELTAEQEKVANLKGTGFVRDLNQAATQSEDLNKAIAEYAQCNTKDEQLEKLDDLAKAWAETSPYYTDKKTDIQAKEFYRSADTNASTINATKARIELEDLDNKINRFEKAAFETDETQNKLHILQQFYGQSDNAVYLEKPSDLGDVIDNIDKDYNALKQDMYENLLFQTRLNPYLQEISVNMDENNQKQFDFSGVENKFQQVYEENPEKALVDLGEFLHYSNIGELDPNLTKQFAKYYVEMGDNAEELIDKEVAKQIIFPDEKDVFADEEINHEINSSEIEILDSKISIDDFAITNNSVEENPQDFNDELAYAEYMPDWRYEEQDDKEPNDDWGMI